MQVFLLISGFLYGSRENILQHGRIQFVKKNVKKVLFDYYVYIILFIIPLYSILERSSVDRGTIWNLATFSGIISNLWHFWYIPFIVLCYCITPMIFDIKYDLLKSMKRDKMDIPFGKYIWKLFFIIVIMTIFFKAYRFYFFPAVISCYIIGFFFPELLRDTKKITFPAICIIVLGIIINIVRYYVRYVWTPLIEVGDWRHTVLVFYEEWAPVFLGLTVFLSIYLMSDLFKNKIKSVKIIKLLDFTDKYSYDIYLVHMVYSYGVLSLLKVTTNIYLNILIMMIAILISAIVLRKICEITEKIIDRFYAKKYAV